MSRRLEDPDDPRWLEAERRLVFLRGLLKANGWTATREVVEATRHEFRIGRSTVYRMIARFRASRKASSLIPTGRGTPDGARRLGITTERLISQEIDRFWLKKERPRMSALIRRVQETCRIEGLPPPHRSTIQRRVALVGRSEGFWLPRRWHQRRIRGAQSRERQSRIRPGPARGDGGVCGERLRQVLWRTRGLALLT